MNKRLLLISSSRVHGGGYLDHAENEIRDLFAGVQRVLFVPYALKDQDGYASVVRAKFEATGYGLDSIHTAADPKQAVNSAQGIFIGGGNTFRLLNTLYKLDLISAIRARVEAGMPYMGSSAGSNVAGLSIKTTNDMPIVQPPSFEAIGLLKIQINPHYLDADPNSTHMGETREQRLKEYLEENDVPVVAIREPAMLRVENDRVQLKGAKGARIFRRGMEPYELEPGSLVEF
ncbi:MAG TPA: dipeptidase PepE [Terriglobales bacterium]|nr:dipeptidase PepE [Terriglobales bacterium]